jgi:hypothetical protein
MGEKLILMRKFPCSPISRSGLGRPLANASRQQRAENERAENGEQPKQHKADAADLDPLAPSLMPPLPLSRRRRGAKTVAASHKPGSD